MNTSPNERRKHLRIDRNFILTYHQKDNSSQAHEVSQVNDVSKGGMNFSTTYRLEVGAAIIIDLKTPFLADSVRLEGTVLECKEKIADMIYEVRLQFKEIPEAVLAVLEKIEKYGKA